MKILIVDDSPSVRSMIRTILEKDGYQVEEGEDGRDALRLIQQYPGEYDLITLDVEMPFDGFRTLKALRTQKAKHIALTKEGRPIPAVFITSRDTIADRVKGFELGATEFISKSLIYQNLLSTINRILKPSERFKGLNALVVDDSPTIRLIITTILAEEGVMFDEAENGRIAYQKLLSNPDAYHTIISDLEMPEMDGLELTHKIRAVKSLKDIPILILSSNTNAEIRIDLFKAGASDYLVKPFIQEELIARLGVHLEVNQANRQLQNSLDALHKSQEKLVESNNERRELLHVLCHDLANPLASVQGALQLSIDEPEIDLSDFRDMMIRSTSNGLAIINMIRQLRELEDKKARLKKEPVNLKEALEESLIMLGHRVQAKEIKIEINIPDELSLYVEPISFKNSILANILTNAIKFSQKGEKITIVGRLNENQVVLSIKDHGIGMPESLCHHIFDLSKTTSRTGTEGETGTGFGMPLMKKFTLVNGGSVEVVSKNIDDSPNDHGTKFILKFPVTPNKSA